MTTLKQGTFRNFNFVIQKGNAGFIGWAKRGKITTGNVVKEPGDVYYEFGDTLEEAEINIKKEIDHIPK